MKTIHIFLILCISLLTATNTIAQTTYSNQYGVGIDKTTITDSLLNIFDKNIQFRLENMKLFFQQENFKDNSANEENIYHSIAIFEAKKESFRQQLTQAISDSIALWDSTILKRIFLLDRLTEEDISTIKVGNKLKLFLSSHDTYKFLFEINEKDISGIYGIILEKNSDLTDYIYFLADRLTYEKQKRYQTLIQLNTSYYEHFNNQLNTTHLDYRVLADILNIMAKNKQNFIYPKYNSTIIVDRYKEQILDQADSLETYAIKTLKDETDRGYIDGQLEKARTNIDFSVEISDFKEDTDYQNTIQLLKEIREYNDTLYYMTKDFSTKYKLSSNINTVLNSENNYIPIEIKKNTIFYNTYKKETSFQLIDAFSLYSIIQQEITLLNQKHKEANTARQEKIKYYEDNVLLKYKQEIQKLNLLLAEIELLAKKELFHLSYFPDDKKKPNNKRIYTAGTLVINDLSKAYQEESDLIKKIQKIQKTMDFYSSMIEISKKEKKDIKELRKTIKKDTEEENIHELFLLLSR